MPIVSSEPKSGVSIFAAPRAFRGHFGIIQTNALESWRRLSITREIILLGTDDGVAEAAEKVGAIHHKTIALDSFGIPLASSVFEIAERTATSEWLCYVNADIILMPEFGASLRRAISLFEKCLVVSRRWNLEVRDRITFDPGWEDQLRARAARDSRLYTVYGIDVFAFRKGLFPNIPAFSLGRPFWDNWMISNARRLGYPVVDATEQFSVIHQDHDYDHVTADKVIRRSQQGLRNFWLAGDSFFGLGHAEDATHCVQDGEIRPTGKKSVSVVIPHAGSFRQLRKCLRALSEQSYPRTYSEIIVVENSEHGVNAPSVLEFPFIKFTREMKRGPASARNKGAAIAQGEVICFLDSDCQPAGDWLEKGVEAALKGRLRSIVACNIRPSIPRHGVAGVKLYEALAYHDQKGYVEECQACITGGMFIPKDVWIRVGPFDEDFSEAACEDWEWSTRATSQGVPILYAPLAVVSHPVHSGWGELRTKARRLVRGEFLLARKRNRYKLLDFNIQFANYSRRLSSELRLILSDKSISWFRKPSVIIAACMVWFWSISEVRRQLIEPSYLRQTAIPTAAFKVRALRPPSKKMMPRFSRSIQ